MDTLDWDKIESWLFHDAQTVSVPWLCWKLNLSKQAACTLMQDIAKKWHELDATFIVYGNQPVSLQVATHEHAYRQKPMIGYSQKSVSCQHVCLVKKSDLKATLATFTEQPIFSLYSIQARPIQNYASLSACNIDAKLAKLNLVRKTTVANMPTPTLSKEEPVVVKSEATQSTTQSTTLPATLTMSKKPTTTKPMAKTFKSTSASKKTTSQELFFGVKPNSSVAATIATEPEVDVDIFGGSSDEAEQETNRTTDFESQMALAFDSAEEDVPIESKLKPKKHQRAQNHVMDSDQDVDVIQVELESTSPEKMKLEPSQGAYMPMHGLEHLVPVKRRRTKLIKVPRQSMVNGYLVTEMVTEEVSDHDSQESMRSSPPAPHTTLNTSLPSPMAAAKPVKKEQGSLLKFFGKNPSSGTC